jgi:hypothetical protein
MSYTLIERKELTSAASSIEITGIPQIYTDLVILTSLRSTRSDAADTGQIRFNGTTTGYSGKELYGTGSTAFSGAMDTSRVSLILPSASVTANTFGNGLVYVPNYTAGTNKSVSVDHVSEDNATTSYQLLISALWSNTQPINSVTVTAANGNLAAGSSISLYGINRQQAIGAPKAVGGAISFANGYWVHSFTGSGTFYAQENLEVDALVVAGGGGATRLAGGGAGGAIVSYGNRAARGFYPILIGSGGIGVENGAENNGTNSAFLSLSAIGGGSGSGSDTADRNGQPGGSGGGAWPIGTGGSGVSGQGNSGGSASTVNSPFGGGGGGGAGGAGSPQTGAATGGAGGPGLLVSFTGSSSFYAGGGAGGDVNSTSVAGGIGGGGSSPSNKNGSANTGGGAGAGGGGVNPGGNGGSGIVIIRYKAD